MTSRGESGDLTAEESADLTERVERFRRAWSPQGSTDLSAPLPPRGARHRLAVLVQVVLTDMERRAAARLPFRVERYINLFPEELDSNTVPAELLVAEYRLRHKYTDRPGIAEYERWFPAQFPAIAEALRRDPLPRGELSETKLTGTIPPVGLVSTMMTDRGSDSRRPKNLPPVMASGDSLIADAPYRLVRKLGAGAFGEVFEARAPGEIPVAVKRIIRSSDHPASRSEKDALEAIKRLSHPFLLKTNAYWIFEDRLVIVMELADTSLADRLTHHQGQGRTGVPPEELIPLFEQAAEALDYLHSESVSHRDIKPENILILKGYAKVADFGLARPHEHTLTVVGNTVGTPAYMAPEMWKQKVSLQSDQYSLAATYVRLRLGRPLFSTTVLIDMANCHVHETPDLNPLPAAEQKVLHKALSKDPDDRYPSCLAFAKALREAVFPAPEPPKAVGAERRSGALLTTIVVAALCAVAVTLGTVFYIRKDQPQEQAEEKKPQQPAVEQKPPEKPLVSVPKGWTEGPESRTIDEKRYPLKLTRVEAGETLVAVLIDTTGTQDLPPFYMLENKITNRVFAKVWKDVEADKNSPHRRWKEGERGALLPIERPETVKKHAADAPALGLTTPQAMLVAWKLGGALPGYRQWLKAVGAMESEPRHLPAKLLPPGLDLHAKREFLELEDIALGLDEPVPVTWGGGDVSVWKIRQLVSNGQEWLGQSSTEPDAKRIILDPAPNEESSAVVVGANYIEAHVPNFDDMRRPETYRITDTKTVSAGFRVVLEPK